MIRTVPVTGSTSADLLTQLRDGERLPEGYWLIADRQTGGRGRLGREWQDGAGNFMGSSVVHLRAGDPPAASLAFVAGLALVGEIEKCMQPAPLPGGERIRRLGDLSPGRSWRGGSAPETAEPPLQAPLAPDGASYAILSPAGRGRSLQLKWPNDVMIGQAKLAGVLLEREGDAVVIGIGVNLASAPDLPERQTIALAELGSTPSRDTFAATLAEALAVELTRWRSVGLPALLSRWLAVAHPIGTRLSVQDAAAGALNGTFAGLTGDGGLQLRLADGSVRAIHAGEVLFA